MLPWLCPNTLLLDCETIEGSRAMRIAYALVSSVLLAGCVAVIPIPQQQAVTRSVPATVATSGFGGALNELRGSRGLPGLGQDARLTRAAQAHAEHMTREGYFSHQSPGGPNGGNMAQRIRSAGCSAGAMAENIAKGQRSEAEVLAAWAASPGHLTNILGPRYRSYGLGQAGDTWVLNFADGC
jgi:uncharacterized protein YkwD